MTKCPGRKYALSAFPISQEIFIRLHRELRSDNPFYLPPGPTFRIRLGASNISFPEPPLEGLSLLDFSDPLNVHDYFVSWEDLEYHDRGLTSSEHEYYKEILDPSYPQSKFNEKREHISCLVDPEAIEAFRDRIGDTPRTDKWGRRPKAA